MYDKQASSQNFPPQGITSKFLANQVNGIVRLGPAERMGTVGDLPHLLLAYIHGRSDHYPYSYHAQCVELNLRWRFCEYTSTCPEIYF